MDNVREIDTVLQHVRRAAHRCRLTSDAAITQQILLFGDSFFGYRFTSLDFTAIWSAADQTLKIFDSGGKVLEVLNLPEHDDELSNDERSIEPVPLTPSSTQQSKAA